jgi:outer membrane protein, heavy metal efflux system
MKCIGVVVWALACALPVPACRAQMAQDTASFDRFESLVGEQHTPAAQGPALTLEEAERIALAENPDIHAAVRRVAAAESQVPLAGALEDPQFMVRSWGVPLAQPWNLNQSQNMLMVSRNLPGPGKRGLQRAVAQSDATVATDELAAVQLRVRVEVRKAFYDLLRAQDDIRVHDQHIGIAQQAIEAARIKYTVGKVPQVEILKAQLALTRLAEHMIHFERDAEVARARMNTLLGREPDAPIAVDGESGTGEPLPSLDDLEKLAMKFRPDLLEAAAVAEKSRREQAVAGKTYVPDFNVTAGYMLMPTGSSFRNNYMVEGAVSLPWLNRHKHEAELAQAAAARTAKDAEVDAMTQAARGQIGEALADAKAAQRLARVYQTALRQQAEETLHAAVIAYENDQTSLLDLLDSQMTVIDVDLASIDATAEFNNRMAELEMVVGAPVEQMRNAAAEEKK